MLAIMSLVPLLLAAGPLPEPDRGDPFVAPLSDEECWKKLPAIATGGGGSLLSWAKAVAASLPRTAAALLELDLAHRTSSPLDPKLRAAMRRVAASENGCAYAVAYAEADARRAGLSDEALEALRRGDLSGWSDPDRLALAFARKMAVESSRITDAEFAALVEVRFVPGALASETTPPPPASNDPLPAPTGRDLIDDDPEWVALPFEALQRRLESQRSRPTRLRIPAWGEVQRGLPENFTHPSRIAWNLVCLGYAPGLAMPWETLMRTNGAENRKRLDRVFNMSVFWIITRSIDCPYCLGHCEMNWEVAGLSSELIAERSRLLAGADWSSFPPEQQRAFAFARRLTRAPGSITAEDGRTLRRDFGPDPAPSLLLYASRCNYMTRISNGFGLTLERDNVFYEYYNVPRPANARPTR
jgi:alkylhydroperoxidase family enzyme